jgi:hypothetical protein
MVVALARQNAAMPESEIRTRWTEADVLALPSGEHDYFDRKAGQVFDDTAHLKGTLAKALCAFANSGGGHLILGVHDDGSVDGVPELRGRATSRDWLEQIIPDLLAYPLRDFRVHAVEPAAETLIPAGREILVIDVGDSPLAPHQCLFDGGSAKRRTYYYREGSNSVAAPHFYLELLRQRLTSPALDVELQGVTYQSAARDETGTFVALTVDWLVHNTGRVAAYKWRLHQEWESDTEGRDTDYYFDRAKYPAGKSTASSMSLDDTLLPGESRPGAWHFGIKLRGYQNEVGLAPDLARMLGGLSLRYRIATESSIAEFSKVPMLDLTTPAEVAAAVQERLGAGGVPLAP